MIFGSSDWTVGQNARSRRHASGSRPMKRVLTLSSPSSEAGMVLSLQPGDKATAQVGVLVRSGSLGSVQQHPVNGDGWAGGVNRVPWPGRRDCFQPPGLVALTPGGPAILGIV